ncbi:hypothetical protein [Rheinheimera faecalis]
MAGKFTQLALLTAGLFLSTKSFAAGECLGFAGSVITYLEFQSTSCPVITSQPQSGAVCELVREQPFVCVELASGGAGGGPWKYTGGLFEENDGGQNPALPPLTPVRPVDWQDPNLNNNGEAVNSNLVKLSESFKTLSESLNNTITDSAANQRNIAARVDKVNTDVQAALSFNTNQTAQQIQTLQSSLNSAQASIEGNDDDNFQTLYDQAERHNDVTQQGIADIKQQANQLQELEFQIDGVMGTVTTANNYVQQTLPQMALANADNFGQVIGGLAVVEQRLDSLNTGGGSGTDMTVTNNLIRETIGNIQGLNPSLNYIGQNTSRTSSLLEEVTYGMSNLYGEVAMQSMLIYTGNQDTSEKLSAINETLQNGVGGGSHDDTETNQKLDGLGEKLDGIGQGIDDISNALKPGSGQKNGPSTCEGKDCWKAASWIESSYPDGVAGLWAERKDAFDRSGMKQYLNSLIPQIGGNGGLKPFELCFDMGFAHYGCHSFTIPPYVIAFIRVCFLIATGFYCQRLVFGGA